MALALWTQKTPGRQAHKKTSFLWRVGQRKTSFFVSELARVSPAHTRTMAADAAAPAVDLEAATAALTARKDHILANLE